MILDRPMKIPHWLVVSMLAASTLAILVVAGWWWVTWPERTARFHIAAFTEEELG
jgi:hypothetical protein